MAHEVGADYMINRTGCEAERAAAEAMSEALGGLPLAHEQAAAYCDDLGVGLAEYRSASRPRPRLCSSVRAMRPAEYHERLTVANLSRWHRGGRKTPSRRRAADRHAALLAPEPIPLFLFSGREKKFGEPLTSALAGEASTRPWRHCANSPSSNARRSQTNAIR